LQNFAAVDLSSFYLDIVKDRLYTAGKKSLSRRACQTVLYETYQALVRMVAPVMPFQAEDMWQNTPENQKGGLESVLLTKWVKVNSEWNNEKLEEEFTKILKTREVVTRAIEPLRAEKKIGSSLEVGVYVKSNDAEILKANEKDLADIFITSQAYVSETAPKEVLNEYSENEITVWVVKAEGEKCERCWKYRNLGEHTGHETICSECFDAISE
jgi:isoleucyl-tRNA synthetase